MAGKPGKSGGTRKGAGRPKEKITLRIGEAFGLKIHRLGGMQELIKGYRVKGVIGKRSKVISVTELPDPA